MKIQVLYVHKSLGTYNWLLVDVKAASTLWSQTPGREEHIYGERHNKKLHPNLGINLLRQLCLLWLIFAAFNPESWWIKNLFPSFVSCSQPVEFLLEENLAYWVLIRGESWIFQLLYSSRQPSVSKMLTAWQYQDFLRSRMSTFQFPNDDSDSDSIVLLKVEEREVSIKLSLRIYLECDFHRFEIQGTLGSLGILWIILILSQLFTISEIHFFTNLGDTNNARFAKQYF